MKNLFYTLGCEFDYDVGAFLPPHCDNNLW